MTVTAHDVAREIRNHIPTVGDVRLQKLLYYCQGLHLAWHGRPMFPERIEAWDMGPVVADVWRVAKYGAGFEEVGHEPLDVSHTGVLDEVLSRYGRLNARELMELTHGEGPWLSVYTPERDLYGRSATIPVDSIEAWFREQEQVAMIEAESSRLKREHPHLGLQPIEVTPEIEAMITSALSGEQTIER